MPFAIKLDAKGVAAVKRVVTPYSARRYREEGRKAARERCREGLRRRGEAEGEWRSYGIREEAEKWWNNGEGGRRGVRQSARGDTRGGKAGGNTMARGSRESRDSVLEIPVSRNETGLLEFDTKDRVAAKPPTTIRQKGQAKLVRSQIRTRLDTKGLGFFQPNRRLEIRKTGYDPLEPDSGPLARSTGPSLVTTEWKHSGVGRAEEGDPDAARAASTSPGY